MSGSTWQPIHIAETILGSDRHICGFFDGPEDEHRVTLPFVREGLERKELAFHIVDPASRAGYARRFEQGGVPVSELEKGGQFELHTCSETYLRRGEFEPDAMLALVEEVLRQSKPRFPLVRFVAHANFLNARQKTRDDWVIYEARLNRLLPKFPDPVLCAYETSKCSGQLIIDLLRTHPVVILGGLLQPSPFFVPPNELLTGGRHHILSRTEPAAGVRKLIGSAKVTRDLTQRGAPEVERLSRATADAENTRLARAREALDRALAEQKKTEELHEQLLGMVSHDLGSPLSSIAFGAAIILKRGTLQDVDAKIVTGIARSARRGSKMISQLLDFTRARLGGGILIDPKPVDLAEVCTEVIGEYEIAYPDRAVNFDRDVDSMGLWDRDRLEQVVANLIGNAIRHGKRDAPINVGVRDEGVAVRLLVHNEGAPIPADLLPSIFEPFRRGATRPAGRETGGLGIGLFIVSEIVRAHSGEIDVESTEAEGTTFIVKLPREPSP